MWVVWFKYCGGFWVFFTCGGSCGLCTFGGFCSLVTVLLQPGLDVVHCGHELLKLGPQLR